METPAPQVCGTVNNTFVAFQSNHQSDAASNCPHLAFVLVDSLLHYAPDFRAIFNWIEVGVVRTRKRNWMLPQHTTHLFDSNFIYIALYSDI